MGVKSSLLDAIKQRNIGLGDITPRAAGVMGGSMMADAVFSEDPKRLQSEYAPSTAIDAYIRKRNERRAGPIQLKYERMAANPVQTIEAPQGAMREASGWAGEKLGELNRRLEGSPLELVSPTGMEDYLKKYAYAETSPLDAALAAFDLGLLTAPKAMAKSLAKPQ